LVTALTVVVLAAAGAVVVASSGSTHESSRPPASAPASDAAVSTTAPPAPLRAVSTRGTAIPVYEQPTITGTPVTSLSASTTYQAPRTLLAFEQDADWYHVYLPTRPNNSTGWVKASDVNVSAPLEYSIKVSLANHKLWVLDNGAVQLTAPVAIGMPEFPTPAGTYYLTDPVDLHSMPNTAYGVFAYGMSGHSDVLTEFGGGDGQIAIHGTNDPSGIGHDVSHGCVRVLNDVIEQIAKLPLGTPVYIS
jgi:lipoprotein-anchoring transpeptidase ErfK/SrfK